MFMDVNKESFHVGGFSEPTVQRLKRVENLIFCVFLLVKYKGERRKGPRVGGLKADRRRLSRNQRRAASRYQATRL